MSKETQKNRFGLLSSIVCIFSALVPKASEANAICKIILFFVTKVFFRTLLDPMRADGFSITSQ